MCTYIVQYIVQDKCCKQILFKAPRVERPRGQDISGLVGYGRGNCPLVLKGHVVRAYPVAWDTEKEIVSLY